DFLKEHPEAVKTFIKEHEASVNAANSDLDTTAALVVAQEIIGKEPIAKKAIPQCNVVCITGDSLKSNLSAYLEVLYNSDPKSVGGKLPGDEFYFKG
ncbi:MAG: ABC transporter substrate-binding protein, partial [Erysipelotrichaceae bacterium]|nr:ABC transporter substrate-binding protein [Erysipelotrichaceae bacterium]